MDERMQQPAQSPAGRDPGTPTDSTFLASLVNMDDVDDALDLDSILHQEAMHRAASPPFSRSPLDLDPLTHSAAGFPAPHTAATDAPPQPSNSCPADSNLHSFGCVAYSTAHTPPIPTPAQHQPSAAAAAPPLDLDALLDDPLNAALLTAQLPKPLKRVAARKGPHTPALPPHTNPPAIAKPRPKKCRPRDTLDALERHLETVVDQIKLLSLRNRHLQQRKHVLEHLVAALTRCETLAQQAQHDLAHHRCHPNDPPRGAAIYHSWNPHDFIAFYKAQVGAGSRWMLEVDTAAAAGQPPPAEALAQLQGSHVRILEAAFYVSHRDGAFVSHVMAEMLKHFPGTLPEEEHWDQVLEAMELTQGQVQQTLVARGVFLQLMERMEREQEAVQATIHEGSQQAEQATSFGGVLNMEEDLLAHVAAILRKNTHLSVLVGMYVFQAALTPLQTAKCALHAHPLFPDPVIILNAIHTKYGQAPGAPQLGAHALPGLASARTLQASLQLYPALAANPTSCPTPPPPITPATHTPPPTASGSGSRGGTVSAASIGPL